MLLYVQVIKKSNLKIYKLIYDNGTCVNKTLKEIASNTKCTINIYVLRERLNLFTVNNTIEGSAFKKCIYTPKIVTKGITIKNIVNVSETFERDTWSNMMAYFKPGSLANKANPMSCKEYNK